MIKNRLHLSPLPVVNTTKHVFYFFPSHISSSVKVLKIRVPTAKHSFRDNCSIVLFIPYYVLLTSISYASMFPGLPATYPPMGQTHRPMGHGPGAPRIHRWVAHRPMGQIDRWRVTITLK